jgi:Tfp pilus assembly protein PilO
MNGRLDQAHFSRKSLLSIAVSLILLALIVALGIWPARSETDRLKAKARDLEARLERQKVFAPLHANLRQKLDQENPLETVLATLPPVRTPLTVDNAAEVLGAMGMAAGMTESHFVPVPVSLTETANRLLVEGHLEGRYPLFRHFLLTLSALPSFEHLELLQIESQARAPRYTVRVWLHL